MKNKTIVITSIIITFILSFLIHFLYEWFPNPIFSIFFPVNESIWEHMKMLYTTILLGSIIEYIIRKKYDNTNNYCLISFIKSIISIPIYLLIFLPIYYNIGENMFIAISTMLITIIIVNIISNKLLNINTIKYQRIIGIILITITYIIMGYLTYYTPHKQIFLDTKDEKYGINDYLIKK